VFYIHKRHVGEVEPQVNSRISRTLNFNFQTFKDQTHFPGHSSSRNFRGKSRTFQEALELCYNWSWHKLLEYLNGDHATNKSQEYCVKPSVHDYRLSDRNLTTLIFLNVTCDCAWTECELLVLCFFLICCIHCLSLSIFSLCFIGLLPVRWWNKLYRIIIGLRILTINLAINR